MFFYVYHNSVVSTTRRSVTLAGFFFSLGAVGVTSHGDKSLLPLTGGEVLGPGPVLSDWVRLTLITWADALFGRDFTLVVETFLVTAWLALKDVS